MKKDASSAKSQKLAFGCPYSAMPKAELEALAVEQIREQRRLMCGFRAEAGRHSDQLPATVPI